MKTVVFVCTGNSCRSPMAEGYLNHFLGERSGKDVRAVSAGTSAIPGYPPTPEAAAVMAEDAVDITAHRTRKLTGELVAEASVIVAMAESHMDAVVALDPGAVGKVYLLRDFSGAKSADRNIRDPIGHSIETYRAVRDEIKKLVKNLSERL